MELITFEISLNTLLCLQQSYAGKENSIKVDDIKILVIEWKSKISVYLVSSRIISKIFGVNMDKLECSSVFFGEMVLTPLNRAFMNINSPVTTNFSNYT